MNKSMGISFLILLGASLFLTGGCCYLNTLRPLDQAKELANTQDYSAASNMEIKCDDSCDGCNQLHLIKGDACYRLAKNGQSPAQHYACAADELAEGIRQTRDWSRFNRTQTYINLSESLRNWRDLSTGSQADGINERLLNIAGQFLSQEPGNPCGIYYQGNARYAQLRSCLLHPEKCPDLCGQLNDISRSLAEGLARPGGADCAPQLREAASELAQAKQAARCQ